MSKGTRVRITYNNDRVDYVTAMPVEEVMLRAVTGKPFYIEANGHGSVAINPAATVTIEAREVDMLADTIRRRYKRDARPNDTLLKFAIQDAGITTKDLADALGVDRTLISKYANGSRNPKYPTRLRIAEELGWDGDPDELFQSAADIAQKR